jgi:redox-sensitive bicupin YhaK (pirin superfamily)
MPPSVAARREVVLVEGPPPGHWVGDGFPVRTMLSYDGDAAAVSPFLLLDYAAPRPFRPTADRRGVGAHPHRGFETVTLVYQGEVEHRDSAGNAGRLGPGDVQWMTAASGVLHEEFHGRAFAERGGVFEVAQVWVNLPAAHKMDPPRYQDLRDAAFPVVRLPDGRGSVRVVAGEVLGARGPARTVTPVTIADLRLDAGGRADLSLPRGHTALLLVTRGPVVVNDTTEAPEGHLVLLDREGESFRVAAEGEGRVLVLGGEPLHEPVVGQGPFVMNTRAEIARAMDDFRSGRFGRLE